MTRKSYVFDASALLCLLNREPGAESVGALMGGAKISAVNLTEVISKLIDKGLDGPTVVSDLSVITGTLYLMRPRTSNLRKSSAH